MGRAEDLFSRLAAELPADRLAAIEELLTEAANEEAFLEFKRSSDHGAGAHLSGKDRENLARALSGFANSDGGVVVWGVSTRSGESAAELLPLAECNRFAGSLDHAVSGLTVPEVPGVRSIPIPLEDGSSKGYVATLVPASARGPHQLVNGKTYLMRAGSTFQPVGHSVLAGMFGRRPQATVFANYAVHNAQFGLAGLKVFAEINLFVMAANSSAVVARDAYLSFNVKRLPSPGSAASFEAVDSREWKRNTSISPRIAAFIAVEGKRLAPFSVEHAVAARFVLVRPFDGDLEVELHTGCDGAPPQTHRWIVNRELLDRLTPNGIAPFGTVGGVASRGPQPIDQLTALQLLGLSNGEARGTPT